MAGALGGWQAGRRAHARALASGRTTARSPQPCPALLSSSLPLVLTATSPPRLPPHLLVVHTALMAAQPEHPLFVAILCGDVPEVQRLLAEQPHLEQQPGLQGMPPVWAEAWAGQPAVLFFALAMAGADVDARFYITWQARSAFREWAVQQGLSPACDDTFALMESIRGQRRPLELVLVLRGLPAAISLELTTALLVAGASPAKLPGDYESPLTWALAPAGR